MKMLVTLGSMLFRIMHGWILNSAHNGNKENLNLFFNLTFLFHVRLIVKETYLVFMVPCATYFSILM